MPQHLGAIALLIRDYDEAIDWYTGTLGFTLVEDTALSADKRWVLVAPPGAPQTRLLLARAADATQEAAVGSQGGGRVWLFLHTDDFAADHARMIAAGVRFLEPPRHEAYGSVAVFEDLYGNRWDLLQRAE
ncbi:VOC family protein [Chiayiivirga flava]|uniref:Catechol 2,3-dioxygenase-like lactoylglutathione lyase family enzyme n=1 Tax=Chiayiivirga flava TaxID=659595 RepID=A0A7W8FZT6_9GAMM|nr:VOC family protein [Chiayiivirga flava]MBB5208461.1 catechol 2,3-dioxygenase-like lactoylglutathione lyase family enzyme [Chiayiivirga flava]